MGAAALRLEGWGNPYARGAGRLLTETEEGEGGLRLGITFDKTSASGEPN